MMGDALRHKYVVYIKSRLYTNCCSCQNATFPRHYDNFKKATLAMIDTRRGYCVTSKEATIEPLLILEVNLHLSVFWRVAISS